MTDNDVRRVREHVWAVSTMLNSTPTDWSTVSAAKARMYAARLTDLAAELADYASEKDRDVDTP